MSAPTIEGALEAALAEGSHFEAAGLIDPEHGKILALRGAADAPYGLLLRLEEVLLRAAQDKESRYQLEQVNAVVFFDLEQRQVVCNLVQVGKRPYILGVVAAPNKTYKQATKRLIKTLQDTLKTQQSRAAVTDSAS